MTALVAGTARAFLLDSLPAGFDIADGVLLVLFVIYGAYVWGQWGDKSQGGSSSTAAAADLAGKLTEAAAGGSDVEKAAAFAKVAGDAAERAVAAAKRAEEAEARATDNSQEQRAMAASSVGSFVTLGVAAAAVLLTGAGVLLGVEGGGTQLARSVFTELILATGWLTLSLILGAISASYVITYIRGTQSVAEKRGVMFPAACQLGALVVGAIYFMLSIILF